MSFVHCNVNDESLMAELYFIDNNAVTDMSEFQRMLF